jgi:hypothetical protein
LIDGYETSEWVASQRNGGRRAWKMNWMMPTELALCWKSAQIDELFAMRVWTKEWEMGAGSRPQVASRRHDARSLASRLSATEPIRCVYQLQSMNFALRRTCIS